MGSQSIPCYPSPTLTAVLHIFPIPCLYSFFILRAFPHKRTKLELSRKNQRTNFVKFQSLQIPSAPDLFTRPASIVAKRFHLQFPGLILSCFKILESLSIASKGNLCPSSYWFQFNNALVLAFTTNDRHVYYGFVYSVDFVQLLHGTNFFGDPSEDLFPSASEKVWCCLLNKMFSFL